MKLKEASSQNVTSKDLWMKFIATPSKEDPKDATVVRKQGSLQTAGRLEQLGQCGLQLQGSTLSWSGLF